MRLIELERSLCLHEPCLLRVHRVPTPGECTLRYLFYIECVLQLVRFDNLLPNTLSQASSYIKPVWPTWGWCGCWHVYDCKIGSKPVPDPFFCCMLLHVDLCWCLAN
jgi:hypothetical protein